MGAKVNCTTVLMDYDKLVDGEVVPGEPLQVTNFIMIQDGEQIRSVEVPVFDGEGEHRKPRVMTFREEVYRALTKADPTTAKDSEKYDAHKILVKIMASDNVELDNDEVRLIRTATGDRSIVAAHGRIVELLTNVE